MVLFVSDKVGVAYCFLYILAILNVFFPKDFHLQTEVNRVVFQLKLAFCMLYVAGDGCAHRFLTLAERDPGVGSWEVRHSKSGGHKA